MNAPAEKKRPTHRGYFVKGEGDVRGGMAVERNHHFGEWFPIHPGLRSMPPWRYLPVRRHLFDVAVVLTAAVIVCWSRLIAF
jgi:hypothetical protein